MTVFKGKKPSDPRELSRMLQGVNDSFCFYDDLSKWDKAELECNNLLSIIFHWLFK